MENSRLASVISKVENGEPVDIQQTLTLQALDIARAGELFLLDSLDSEDESDAFLERFGRGA